MVRAIHLFMVENAVRLMSYIIWLWSLIALCFYFCSFCFSFLGGAGEMMDLWSSIPTVLGSAAGVVLLFCCFSIVWLLETRGGPCWCVLGKRPTAWSIYATFSPFHSYVLPGCLVDDPRALGLGRLLGCIRHPFLSFNYRLLNYCRQCCSWGHHLDD